MKPITKEMFRVRSSEEMYFILWLNELSETGYIHHYDYENVTFYLSQKRNMTYTKQLKTKIKYIEKELIKGHSYSPDFDIEWNKKAKGIFFEDALDMIKNKNVPLFAMNSGLTTFVEIKPVFDRLNMTREFIVNQKWVLRQDDRYINLVKPMTGGNSLFAKTFTPRRFIYTDVSMVKRKITFKTRTLEEYVATL